MLENLQLDYVQHLERGYCANHPDVLSGAKDQVVDRAVKQLLQALQASPLKDLSSGLKIGNGLLKFDAEKWQYSNDNGATWQEIGSGAGDHLLLTNIGSHNHTQIDSHINQADIHLPPASIGHQALSGAGAYDHSQVDGHINDNLRHITDHHNLSNKGSNSHAAIDDHIANTSLHSGGGGGSSTPVIIPKTSSNTLTTAEYQGQIILCNYDGYLDLPSPTTDGQNLWIVHTYAGNLSVRHHISVNGVINSADDDWGGTLNGVGQASIWLVYRSGLWLAISKTGTWNGSQAG